MTLERWEEEHLPVLRVIVEATNEGAWHVEPEQIAQRTGLDLQTVRVALMQLAGENPPFFKYQDLTAMGDRIKIVASIHEPTGHAQRTVGTWPKPEDRIDQIVRVLEELAAKTNVPEEKEALSKTARVMRGAGSLGAQLVIGVASGLTSTAITGGGG